MRELKPDDVIEATDVLQTPKPVKFRVEWSTVIPAGEIQSRGGKYADGFVGKRVRDCEVMIQGKRCKWLRPD